MSCWEGHTALLKTVFLAFTPSSFLLWFYSSLSLPYSVSFYCSMTISGFSFGILIHFSLNLLCIYFSCLGVLRSGLGARLLCSSFPRQGPECTCQLKLLFVCFVLLQFCFLRSSVKSLIVTESKLSSCPSGFIILIYLVKNKTKYLFEG